MQICDLARFQPTDQFKHFNNVESTLCSRILCEQTHAENEIGRNYLPDRGDNFKQKAGSVLKRPAPAVNTLIGESAEELREKITICGMYLCPT